MLLEELICGVALGFFFRSSEKQEDGTARSTKLNWEKKTPRSINVIKLSKNGAHKKYPPRKVEVGIFCFGKSCLLGGQDDDLSLVNDVGVHKTVGVALEDGLYFIKSQIC